MNDRDRGLVAVIPLRDLHTGKSRLSPDLDEQRRAHLIAAMARHVVEVALASPAIAAVQVVTKDVAAVAALLGDTRGTVIAQPSQAIGLNGALSDARLRLLESRRYRGMLILHADLPLVSVADVEEIIDQRANLVLAADRHHVGTNAMLMRWDPHDAASSERARAFRLRFGDDSFRAHLAQAAEVGYLPATVLQPGTEFDLDTLGDWNLLPLALRERLDAPDRETLIAAI